MTRSEIDKLSAIYSQMAAATVALYDIIATSLEEHAKEDQVNDSLERQQQGDDDHGDKRPV